MAPQKVDKGKIKLELAQERVGWGQVFTYLALGLIMVLYVVFLNNPAEFERYGEEYPPIKPVVVFFKAVENYSPFHEFLNDVEQESKPVPEPKPSSPGIRILTKAELKLYDGTEGSPGLYLALLGQVFDVAKGRDYYGPGGGYGFFAATDGSRGFVTGDFNEEGLVDEVSGLSGQDYLGLQEWTEFYHKDYTYVGKLVGNFYDPEGRETEALKEFHVNVRKAQADKAQNDVEKLTYPPCNTEWSQKKGHRVWCTAKTGGIDRGWVGKPRKLYLPGKSERCSCIKDFGPPATDPSAKSDHGDLKSPHVKEYEGCDSSAVSCILSPPQADKEEL
eukprot:snap_masked-scaffold1322_size48131-processed-gene-0.6 protein:Tk01358 transcript:snap_masked-scaffold1322_size48131-processed-gene-0.6-mRNA-1 annotation:"neuferricin-like isoform x1"